MAGFMLAWRDYELMFIRDAGARLHDGIGVGNESAYDAAPSSQAPAQQTC